MRFEGKVVCVTGGARGIGKAIVTLFAKEGATVVFTYHDSKDTALQLEAELCRAGMRAQACHMDVTDTPNVKIVIDSVTDTYGRLDVLVNNAGVTQDGFLMFMGEDSWDHVVDTNLKGAYANSKAVLPVMLGQKAGVIINVSSIAGFMGTAGQTNYCASKAGLIGFTKALSKEVAAKNIRVNAVAPGYIQTEMLNKVPEPIRNKFKAIIPCSRIGQPEEVARVILFLASEDASYIHGQTIIVDGGIV
ncbi:3-oxoacyl-[acyl-carrier-protein] reductase [Gorillibacterium sp. sgz500922]|uniref:3-oxoacyl-[acyl-carrier-protein] reductase n=1 Tax=Gorillibacterium sp. sgz500922 TaxID=3446694 RepID=UPI003F66F84C